MKNRDKIFATHERLLEAMLSKDEKVLKELIHPDASVFGSAIHEYSKGVDNVIGYYSNSLALLPDDRHLNIKDRHFTDLGNQALVEVEFEISFTLEDQNITLLSLRQSALWICEKNNGDEKWLLLHDHTSMPDHLGSIEEISTDELLDANLNLELDSQKLQAKLDSSLKQLNRMRKQLLQNEKLAAVGQLAAGIAHEIKNPLNFVNNFSEVTLEMIEELRDEVRDLRRETRDVRRENRQGTEDRGPADSLRQPAEGKDGEAGQGDDAELANASNPDPILEILDDIEANIRKIREHGGRANSIVKSMLLHSRGKSGSPVPTDLNKLLDEHLKLAYHGMRATNSSFNVDIITEYDSQLPEIKLIPQDMSRAFLNIINNAMYAAYEHSVNSPNREPKLEIRTILENKHAVLKIRDNGSGIPDKIREQIFEPFFTTKPAESGTGLGLSMTSDIVKMHKGTIEVESEHDQFTEFTITIPVV